MLIGMRLPGGPSCGRGNWEVFWPFFGFCFATGYIAWIDCGICCALAGCRTAVRNECPLLFLLE